MNKLKMLSTAFTSLATGADQVFARCALQAGLQIISVIPFDGYERCFRDESLLEYHHLLARSRVVTLSGQDSDEESFFEAGKYVADNSDIVFAVWDERPSEGFGGTADIVGYSYSSSKKVLIINPITRCIKPSRGNDNG